MWLGVAVEICNICLKGRSEVSCPIYLSEALKIPAMKSPGKPGIVEAMSMT
jgi:hypothetical protein